MGAFLQQMPAMFGGLGRRMPYKVIGEDQLGQPSASGYVVNGLEDGDSMPMRPYSIAGQEYTMDMPSGAMVPGAGEMAALAPHSSPKPSMWSKALPILRDAAMGAIDAGSTPNVAGGGGYDMVRAAGAALQGRQNRDILATQLQRQAMQDADQRQYRQAQIEHQRAQDAEMAAYRQSQIEENRAQAAARNRRPTHFDAKTGNWYYADTGELLRKGEPGAKDPTVPVGIGPTGEVGDYGAPLAVPTASPMGGQKDVNFPAWGNLVNMDPRDAAAMTNAQTLKDRVDKPKQSVTYGTDAQGNKIAIVTTIGPDGNPVTSTQNTGTFSRAPKAPGSGAGGGRGSTLTANAIATVNNRKKTDLERANKIYESSAKSPEDLEAWRSRIKLAQENYEQSLSGGQPVAEPNLWYETATPPTYRKPKAGGPTPQGGKPAPQKTFPASHLAGFAKENGLTEAQARNALTTNGYVIQ